MLFFCAAISCNLSVISLPNSPVLKDFESEDVCGLENQYKDSSTDKLLEEARKSMPDCCKVLHLVKAFAKLLSIPKSSQESDDDQNECEKKKVPLPEKCNGGRRNTSESIGPMGGRIWKKKQRRITSQKPFKLRTECLIKPLVKEITRPVDLKLHSDVLAVEHAEFDYQVAEKMTLIEQYKMEREEQQKKGKI